MIIIIFNWGGRRRGGWSVFLERGGGVRLQIVPLLDIVGEETCLLFSLTSKQDVSEFYFDFKTGC